MKILRLHYIRWGMKLPWKTTFTVGILWSFHMFSLKWNCYGKCFHGNSTWAVFHMEFNGISVEFFMFLPTWNSTKNLPRNLNGRFPIESFPWISTEYKSGTSILQDPNDFHRMVTDHFRSPRRAISLRCMSVCPDNNFWIKWPWNQDIWHAGLTLCRSDISYSMKTLLLAYGGTRWATYPFWIAREQHRTYA